MCSKAAHINRQATSNSGNITGDENAVLIKSAIYCVDHKTSPQALEIMTTNNPIKFSDRTRSSSTLGKGQTLVCRSLMLKVPDWDQRSFSIKEFYIEDCGYRPKRIVQTRRLGIPKGRDEHLLYRFIDEDNVRWCCKNPLTQKGAREHRTYRLICD
ncbi:MAG: DNA-3-methyladenine glycosylase [Bdellovibrionota bacterium]